MSVFLLFAFYVLQCKSKPYKWRLRLRHTAMKYKKNPHLRARDEAKLLSKAKHNIGPLAQAIVRDMGGGSPVGLAGQQLPLRTGQYPHLEKKEQNKYKNKNRGMGFCLFCSTGLPEPAL